MNIRLDVELTEQEFDKLWNRAACSFIREEPRKLWTDKEKKEAVRWYLSAELRARVENT